MKFKYYTPNEQLFDFDDAQLSFQKKENFNDVFQELDALKLQFDECVNGIGKSCQIVHQQNLRKAIRTLRSEINEIATSVDSLNTKELECKVSMTKENIQIKKNEVAALEDSCGELIRTNCSIEAEHNLIRSKATQKHMSLCSLIECFKRALNIHVSLKENIYEVRFTHTKKDVCLRFLMEDKLELVGVHPKLKCIEKLIERANSSGDFQGLMSLFNSAVTHG